MRLHPEMVLAELETSFMLLIAPSVTVYKTFKETTKNGTFGDPIMASTEKGDTMLSAVAARMTELCSHLLANRI